jgi:hypothetical protein
MMPHFVGLVIDRVLNFVRGQAELALRAALGTPPNENHVEYSRIVGDNGQVDIKGTLGMALIRLEEDRIFPSRTRTKIQGENTVHYTQPEMALTLHVLFAAAPHEKYGQMLQALAVLVTWARANRSFSAEQHSDLAENGIARLTLEFEALSYEGQNHIWGSLGGHFLPSFVLLIRFVPIRPDVITNVGRTIGEVAHDETSP